MIEYHLLIRAKSSEHKATQYVEQVVTTDLKPEQFTDLVELGKLNILTKAALHTVRQHFGEEYDPSEDDS